MIDIEKFRAAYLMACEAAPGCHVSLAAHSRNALLPAWVAAMTGRDVFKFESGGGAVESVSVACDATVYGPRLAKTGGDQ